jgi:hypothetical protein
VSETKRPMERIERDVTAEPVEAHGYIVTPLARIRGRLGSSNDERGSGNWGWVAIRPARMTVHDPSGQAREVRLDSVQAQALTGMAVAGILVALVSMLISALSRSKQKLG